MIEKSTGLIQSILSAHEKVIDFINSNFERQPNFIALIDKQFVQ
ncbi:hypothetical protein [Domibacillus iocasae]|nr:hypothetical protein [Domibacillus iocasae]